VSTPRLLRTREHRNPPVFPSSEETIVNQTESIPRIAPIADEVGSAYFTS
jgi:hypothetical protein